MTAHKWIVVRKIINFKFDFLLIILKTCLKLVWFEKFYEVKVFYFYCITIY